MLSGSLWHKGAYNRTFPCMEATYPLCHKEPARSKQKAPSRGLWMRQAGSLWHKRAGVATLWSRSNQLEQSLDIPRPMRVENSAWRRLPGVPCARRSTMTAWASQSSRTLTPGGREEDAVTLSDHWELWWMFLWPVSSFSGKKTKQFKSGLNGNSATYRYSSPM